MSRYFPLFIDLEGKKIAVVGAGRIASRRIRVLLDFGARLMVIAPEATEEVERLAGSGELLWLREAYRPGLLEGSTLVLAATDSPKVNLAVYEECRALDIPVNLADDKERCDFYFPGIARGGGVVAGVTAEGRDHRLAREAAERIRRLLSEDGEMKRTQTKETKKG